VKATTTTRTITLSDIAAVELEFTERGDGNPYLVLHGGAGPLSVASFADLLADRVGGRVITPTHRGFAGTHRPDGLRTTGHLAELYAGLLEDLDLTGVTVIGNSIGGWLRRLAGEGWSGHLRAEGADLRWPPVVPALMGPKARHGP